MWNDTDIPIAYLITFRCYGTWLHGDERGSIDRFHNAYQSPYIEPNAGWKDHNAAKMRDEPVTLTAAQRNVVERAVREVCEYKQWFLHALSIRTNHGHTVVSIGGASSKAALNAFKAYATRDLRSNGLWDFSHSPWADKGSRRRIWNQESLHRAIDYVVNGQGGPLPDFD
jgi:REP element-mobilizing transposase RayT